MIGSSLLTNVLQRFWPQAIAPAKADDATIDRIREESESLNAQSEKRLAEQLAELRKAVAGNAKLLSDDVLVPAFALVIEAARRVLSIRLYDVQLLAGLALARGHIAEMQTGEGKTFVAMLPAVLHALGGRGVHVMTVNDYLARRDYELLAPVFRMLGVSVGLLERECDPRHKQAAYRCDVTYGPGYEFGFDYLRDQVSLLARRKPALGESFRRLRRGEKETPPLLSQRGHAFAVIDEADSVLLDEATTPLILGEGGQAESADAPVYVAAAQLAQQLCAGDHFVVEPATGAPRLTPHGLAHINADRLAVPRKGLRRAWAMYVEQALQAAHQLRRDVHYVVRDAKIMFVDQNTGRVFADRTWRDGLHQAIQAKEGVAITDETKTIARITRQRYFRLYDKLCGMTGTARGSERELRAVYGLQVVAIPPNKPCQRRVLPARFFADLGSKEQAIAEEVLRIHRTGQPILVGTATIDASERLAQLLNQQRASFRLLNGKQDAQEAQIVAGAGQAGSITIATNMAGRGTDIKLGSGAGELDGLHVIAAEPQESQRVDRQLMGRAARQGDPGSVQLFVSAEDRLIARHDPPLAGRMKRLADLSGEVHSDHTSEIARLQRRVEQQQAQLRRQMFAHDDWLESVLSELTREA